MPELGLVLLTAHYWLKMMQGQARDEFLSDLTQ
jgi:hypothetical protein